MREVARHSVMEIQNIITEPHHHAYIVFGYAAEDVHTQQNKGLYVMRTEKELGVDAVRELHSYAFQGTDGAERKIIIFSTPGVSLQAQNALLKMMEETGEGTHFFLCLPQGTELLSTLLSRCYIIDNRTAHAGEMTEHFQRFIHAHPKDRLAMLEKIWDQGESIRHSAILQLLQDFEKHIHRLIVDKKTRSDIARHIRVARNLRDALYTGALHKGTLHALAFV